MKKALQIVAAFCLLSPLMSGCSVSPAKLSSTTDNMQTWTANAPIIDVFKRYRTSIEDNEGSLLIGGGIKLDGLYYGESAEFDLKMIGAFETVTCLHVELEKQGDSTNVKAWHYSSHWKDEADKLKGLF